MSRSRVGRVVAALLPVVFFAAVVWLLRDELVELELDKIREALGQISGAQLVLAAAITATAYGLLTTFDVLARKYVGHSLGLGTTIAISFVSYAFNFNIGGVAGAVGFRYRLYSKHGLRAADIAAITLFAVIATWAGWLILLGICFALRPELVPASWGLSRLVLRMLAAALMVLPLLYLWACAVHRREMRLGRWAYRFPELRLAIAQVVLGSAYWLCPAAMIWNLQPQARSAHYEAILASYLLSAMAGLILHVPAGLGVFEAVFLQTLGRTLGSDRIVAMLLAYRGIYLLGPLALAAAGLLILEWRARHGATALSSSRPGNPPRASRETLHP